MLRYVSHVHGNHGVGVFPLGGAWIFAQHYVVALLWFMLTLCLSWKLLSTLPSKCGIF